MKKHELIFVPAPAVGHILSTLEFANRLLRRDPHLSVTVLALTMPVSSSLDPYVKSLFQLQPRIRLIQLPEIAYPPPELLAMAVEKYIDDVIESYKPLVRTVISDIISSRRSESEEQSAQVSALILDLFCVTMIDIGNEFGIPSYMFFTSGAGFLSFMLDLPSRHRNFAREFKNTDPDLSLRSFTNPLPVKVLPSAAFNTHGAYDSYVKIASRFRDVKGIVVNTFAELESRAINALSDGETPPIYPVGPIIDLTVRAHPELDRARWDEIAEWLHEQPESSVLFLCFGSAGGFGKPQMEEIALGLEKSRCRFLWCLRAPFGTQSTKPEELLPEGFRERIGDRGMVTGWAPQVEVLSHKAIGGFVSHCGWNSIMESLWHGVPVVTLPIYAEQQLNAFLMVKELGLAEELKMDYRPNQLVRSDELEGAVKRVMRSDSTVRKKVIEIGEMARRAVAEGGSSDTSMAKFIMDIKSNS